MQRACISYIYFFDTYPFTFVALDWFKGKEKENTLDDEEQIGGMQPMGNIQSSIDDELHLNGATAHSSHQSHSVGSCGRKDSVYTKSLVKPQKGGQR